MKAMHLKITPLCWAILLVIASTSCHTEKKQKETTQLQSPRPTVALTKVSSLQPSKQVVLPGELKPWNRVSISAKVRGYVGDVQVDRGTQVKSGQILAVLEAPEIKAALSNAQANVAAAEARLIEQQATLKSSKLTYERTYETSQTAGAVSANELDQAYASMMADSALASSSQGALEAAKAQLISQKQLVSYLTVRAPFDGVIIERNVSPGTLVGTSDSGGSPMFVLEDQSKLRLTVAIPENLANSIPENTEATFTVTADPGRVYQAVYARSANSLQEHNRSMLTEFDVDNRDGRLKAGMYAEATLPVSRNASTLFVPASSVVTSSEGVYVIRKKENVADWVRVSKGSALDTLVEVFGALQAGELIVKNADPELRDGMALD
ncbi:MAG: efflux RND transporter periplasmic adaptor subunit [Cyclobacteriaceae bacterium]